ncbi:hypothetical protein BH09PSE4_BH09PSE4_21880 [soil metagenome]
MLFNNPSQFAVLGILLIVGWLFGFASHPGGKKWKRAYTDESVDHAAYRDQAETQAREDQKRIAELERANAGLQRDVTALEAKTAVPAAAPVPLAVPVTEPLAVAEEPAIVEAPVEPVADAVPVTEPEPLAEVEPEKKGWFSWVGTGDDLTKIRGIDSIGAATLAAHGVKSFADIESLSHEDEMALEQRIGAPAGTIQRDQWREQAEMLAAGKTDEHKERFETA